MRSNPKDILGLPALSLDGWGSGVELTSPSLRDGMFFTGCIEGYVLSALKSPSVSSCLWTAFRFKPRPMLGCAGFLTPPRFSFMPAGCFVSSYDCPLWMRPVFGSFTSFSFWIKLLWPSLPSPPSAGINGFFWLVVWTWSGTDDCALFWTVSNLLQYVLVYNYGWRTSLSFENFGLFSMLYKRFRCGGSSHFKRYIFSYESSSCCS